LVPFPANTHVGTPNFSSRFSSSLSFFFFSYRSLSLAKTKGVASFFFSECGPFVHIQITSVPIYVLFFFPCYAEPPYDPLSEISTPHPFPREGSCHFFLITVPPRFFPFFFWRHFRPQHPFNFFSLRLSASNKGPDFLFFSGRARISPSPCPVIVGSLFPLPELDFLERRFQGLDPALSHKRACRGLVKGLQPRHIPSVTETLPPTPFLWDSPFFNGLHDGRRRSPPPARSDLRWFRPIV